MTGIYKITNTITKKVYIGLSNDIEQRWKTHKKRYKIESDKEYEKYLYRSFRKYGLEAFTFEVIEECPPEKEKIIGFGFLSKVELDSYNEWLKEF